MRAVTKANLMSLQSKEVIHWPVAPFPSSVMSVKTKLCSSLLSPLVPVFLPVLSS